MGDNKITGGGGSDTITGGLGRDRFTLSALSESLLGANSRPLYDHITDFEIGSDIIDGPSSVPRGQVKQLPALQILDAQSLQSHLSSQQLPANGAAIVSSSGGMAARWFLILNDSIAGYNASRDAIIEITGFTGRLSDMQVL